MTVMRLIYDMHLIKSIKRSNDLGLLSNPLWTKHHNESFLTNPVYHFEHIWTHLLLIPQYSGVHHVSTAEMAFNTLSQRILGQLFEQKNLYGDRQTDRQT